VATYDVQINDTHAVVKHRQPVIVGLLSLFTLYIYAIYWWYQVARELRDLGQSRGTDLGEEPGLSALAISLGALVIVPAVITIYATCLRVQRAQQMAGTYQRLNGWLAGLSAFFLFPVFTGYMQSQLNQVWESPTIGSPLLPPGDLRPLPQPANAPTPTGTAAPPPPSTATPPAPPPPPPQPAAQTPADWYPDPTGQARLRYWDGTTWTHHTTN
jgi:Protein of unknown function (DUF2510)/Domain of unknown function (DUF4234)